MLKKKAKKKVKKGKAAVDDEDLFLDACIAETKTWPHKMQMAVGSIRKLTASPTDYSQWARDGQLIEWPSPEEVLKEEDPQSLKLKKLSFFVPTKECQKNVGIHEVRAGIKFET